MRGYLLNALIPASETWHQIDVEKVSLEFARQAIREGLAECYCGAYHWGYVSADDLNPTCEPHWVVTQFENAIRHPSTARALGVEPCTEQKFISPQVGDIAIVARLKPGVAPRGQEVEISEEDVEVYIVRWVKYQDK